MKVREIKREDIKTGSAIYLYDENGVYDMRNNGYIVKNIVDDYVVIKGSGGLSRTFTIDRILSFFRVEDKPTGIPTFDGDLPQGAGQYGEVMTYIGGTARHATDGKNYNVTESDMHGKYKIIGDDGNEWHCAKESFIDPSEFKLPQGTKNDKGKLKPTLLLDDMPLAIQEILKVLQFGAEKYSEGNWLKVDNGINRYRNAADRHRLAIDELDDESGMMHLAHEATSVLMLLELKLREKIDAE